MQIILLPKALSDIENIKEYIGEENPKVAIEVSRKIEKTISYLGEYPNLGKPTMIDSLREIKVAELPFVVCYRVKHQRIIISRVFHGRQNRL